jgi:hypothetical protein
VKPLLAAIRLRYRLTSLELVPAGEFWAVQAVVNPTITKKVDAKQPTKATAGGRLIMSPAAKKAALADLKKITKPEQVNPAMVELAAREKGILERYKTLDPDYSYVAYVNRTDDGKEFDPPLTYLQRRASVKRGKATESNWASKAFPGGSPKAFKIKSGKTFTTVIPDICTSKVIADVKNVKYQDFDAQLKSFEKIAHADEHPGEVFETDEVTSITKRRSFGLVYRRNEHPEGPTKLSANLNNALDIHKDIIDN